MLTANMSNEHIMVMMQRSAVKGNKSESDRSTISVIFLSIIESVKNSYQWQSYFICLFVRSFYLCDFIPNIRILFLWGYHEFALFQYFLASQPQLQVITFSLCGIFVMWWTTIINLLSIHCYALTLLQLVANFSCTKWCKKAENITEPLVVGTHPWVLSES